MTRTASTWPRALATALGSHLGRRRWARMQPASLQGAWARATTRRSGRRCSFVSSWRIDDAHGQAGPAAVVAVEPGVGEEPTRQGQLAGQVIGDVLGAEEDRAGGDPDGQRRRRSDGRRDLIRLMASGPKLASGAGAAHGMIRIAARIVAFWHVATTTESGVTGPLQGSRRRRIGGPIEGRRKATKSASPTKEAPSRKCAQGGLRARHGAVAGRYLLARRLGKARNARQAPLTRA
jgi:hypothetical protein